MDEVIKFIQESFECTVKFTEYSTYIKISNKYIRISNHISTNNAGCYLNILTTIDNKYVVAFKNRVFIINTLKRLQEYLWDFISIFEGCSLDSSNVDRSIIGNLNKQKEELLKNNEELLKKNKQLQTLNKNLANGAEFTERINAQRKELALKDTKLKESKEEIAQLKANIEEQKNAINDAVDLIKLLTEDPNSRDLLYSKDTSKTYYIDNFPKEYQEIIKELIKTYGKK